MHRINAICNRVECTDGVGGNGDANKYWIVIEFLISGIFTVELLVRVLVSNSLSSYFRDAMNLADFLSVFPFYAELFNALLGDGIGSLNFTILASSPGSIFLITMRSFKVYCSVNELIN